ncbi:MAG: GerMN domain-containing protein, partial [Spirochaetota bacterium]
MSGKLKKPEKQNVVAKRHFRERLLPEQNALQSAHSQWGSIHEEAKKPPRDRTWDAPREALLWLLFLMLLILVVVFSQHKWVLRLFPFVSNGHDLQMNIEIARIYPDKKEAEVSPTRFDQLLRLNTGPEGEAQKSSGFRDVRLFFVQVEDEGRLRLKSVLRKIPFDEAPLSRTIGQLFTGPGPQEINKGLYSMLPPEMQVLSIRIIGMTAYINLSEEFYQITELTAVLLAAVKQLVFTVT